MREAVADAGEYEMAPATESFYQQIAREIKAACSSGRLKCNNHDLLLSSFVPMDSEYLEYFPQSLASVSNTLLHGMNETDLDSGLEDNFVRKKFEKIIKEPAGILSRRADYLNQYKDKLIISIGTVYKGVLSIFVGCATVGLILQHMSSMNYRRGVKEVPLHILWLFLLCIAVRVVLVTYIDTTSFPGDFRYLWPVIPLLLMSISIGVSYLVGTANLLRKF